MTGKFEERFLFLIRYFSLFWLGIAPLGGNFIFNFQKIRAGLFVQGFRHGKGIARENGLIIVLLATLTGVTLSLFPST